MNQRTLAEVSKAPRYRVWGADEVVYGPIELLTLVDWVREHRVTPECWVNCDRNRAWAKAGTMDELKPLFRDHTRLQAMRASNPHRAGVTPESLQRVKLLNSFSEPQLEAFLHYVELLTIEPPKHVITEGEAGHEMYLILEGELRVEVTRHDKRTILATLKAGDFFGEVALLDQGPRSADVVPNERSTLLRLAASSFARMRLEAPALAEPFLFALGKSVVGRVRVLNRRYKESLMALQALTIA